MPKLFDLGFDVTKVTAGMGVAPIAPLCEDERIVISNIRTGKVFSAGAINRELLKRSLLE